MVRRLLRGRNAEPFVVGIELHRAGTALGSRRRPAGMASFRAVEGDG